MLREKVLPRLKSICISSRFSSALKSIDLINRVVLNTITLTITLLLEINPDLSKVFYLV
jgi:hypothetical protein